MNTTVKLALAPDLSIHVLLVSQPVTATERTFPYTEPDVTKNQIVVGNVNNNPK